MATVAGKAINPYVEKLAAELRTLPENHEIQTEDGFGAGWIQEAQYVTDTIVVPKNKRIHELVERINKLEAEIGRLGKVLNRHSAGEWHQDKETAIECAIRLLSPTRDDAASRDRP